MNKEFQNKKASGFKVPEGYFESLDSKLSELTKASPSIGTSGKTGFMVPEGYFENFKVTPKKTKIITLKRMLYISSIAAMLTLLFTVLSPEDELTFDSLETATIENYLLEESYETSEIASLLNEKQLTMESFNLAPEEEQLEDYLIQNTAIENLIDF